MLVAPAAPATHTQVSPLAFASPSGSPRLNQMRNPPKAINAHMRPPRHSTATQALPNEGRSVWQWPWVSRSWAPAVSMAAALLFMVLGKRQWDASQQRPAIQQVWGPLGAAPHHTSHEWRANCRHTGLQPFCRGLWGEKFN